MSDYKSMICACQHADLNNYIIIVSYLLVRRKIYWNRTCVKTIQTRILSPCRKVNRYLHSRITIDIV